MHCVSLTSETRGAPQVARLGDLEHRHTRVLLVIGTEPAIVRAAVVPLSDRHGGCATRAKELTAPPPPGGVAQDQRLGRPVLGARPHQPHLPIALDRFGLHDPKTGRTRARVAAKTSTTIPSRSSAIVPTTLRPVPFAHAGGGRGPRNELSTPHRRRGLATLVALPARGGRRRRRASAHSGRVRIADAQAAGDPTRRTPVTAERRVPPAPKMLRRSPVPY